MQESFKVFFFNDAGVLHSVQFDAKHSYAQMCMASSSNSNKNQFHILYLEPLSVLTNAAQKKMECLRDPPILTTHMGTPFILLNADPAVLVGTGFCGALDFVLRSLEIWITMSLHAIELVTVEIDMPGGLMVEAHLEPATAAGDTRVFILIQFAIGTALAETPSEVGLGGDMV